MRFAVLSDIHGNVRALAAVLEDARRRQATDFINLGDMLYGPLEPLATYELLQTMGAFTIQGNQDREVYEADLGRIKENPTLGYVLEQLGSGPVRWLASLPKTLDITDRVFACHGSPTSDMAYLLEDVTRGVPTVRPEENIVDDLNGVESPVILCGHTHVARVVRLSSGQLLVNPGSVGVPAFDDNAPNYHSMEAFSPLASYAIIESRDGAWHVDLLKVPYDFQAAAAQARRQGREDWAQWVATGRTAPREPS